VDAVFVLGYNIVTEYLFRNVWGKPKCGYTLVTIPCTMTSKWLTRYGVNGLKFHPVPLGVTVCCELYTMGFLVCYGRQKHHECKEGERKERRWRDTLHVKTCSGRKCIIPLMRRPNTDCAPNKPATSKRNQILIRYVVTSPVRTVTIRCYGTR
jgi:hypothetical protein